MKKNYQIIIYPLLGLMLSGCSAFHSNMNSFSRNDTHYMRSHSIPTLDIPAGLSSIKVGDDYPIPPSNSIGRIPAPVVSPYAHDGVISRDRVISHLRGPHAKA